MLQVLSLLRDLKGLKRMDKLSNYSSMEGSHTRSPSKDASMFSGTQEKFASCVKTAYPLEKVRPITSLVSNVHTHGGLHMTPSNYAALEGVLYCKHHFSQLLKEKGSYNNLIKSASIKRAPNSVPQA
ncbi:hypothetical protein VNO78_31572 [Psophocarpus tetragonolobus]|uniref:Uncharacterized protein n=1 Tax=Psophocarpus tetragonolobus TaxID=3891 RepID=A0AAN9X7D0_PSOTE